MLDKPCAPSVPHSCQKTMSFYHALQLKQTEATWVSLSLETDVKKRAWASRLLLQHWWIVWTIMVMRWTSRTLWAMVCPWILWEVSGSLNGEHYCGLYLCGGLLGFWLQPTFILNLWKSLPGPPGVFWLPEVYNLQEFREGGNKTIHLDKNGIFQKL